MKDLISINKAFARSFEIFKKDPATLSVVTIVLLLASWILKYLSATFKFGFIDLLGLFITFYFGLVLSLLVYFIARGEKRTVKQIFRESVKLYLIFVWTSVVSFLVVTLGSLLVILGIIFSVWFAPLSYIIIHNKIGGFKALWKSRELVRGYFWPVFILSIPYILSLILDITFVVGAHTIWKSVQEELGIVEDIVSAGGSLVWALYTYVIYSELVKAKKK